MYELDQARASQLAETGARLLRPEARRRAGILPRNRRARDRHERHELPCIWAELPELHVDEGVEVRLWLGRAFERMLPEVVAQQRDEERVTCRLLRDASRLGSVVAQNR